MPRWWSTWNRLASSTPFGLATLVGAAKRAAAHGGSLQVACALPKIRQLVRLTGLDCTIPLARTLDEALEFRAATSTNPPC